jgi:hypothetical protein
VTNIRFTYMGASACGNRSHAQKFFARVEKRSRPWTLSPEPAIAAELLDTYANL